MPEKLRYRRCVCVVGCAGTGKSTLVRRTLEKRGENALVYLEAVDFEDKTWRTFPAAKLYDYTAGLAKINANEVPYPEFLQAILQARFSGAVVIDEAAYYEINDFTPLMRQLAGSRRKGINGGRDIYLMYHGVTDLPIRAFKHFDGIVLFHTSDEFTYKSGKVPRMKELLAAKQRIAGHYHKGRIHYCEYISFR